MIKGSNNVSVVSTTDALPKNMRAAAIDRFGGPEVLSIVGPFRYDPTEQFPAGYEVWQLEQARDIKSVDVLRWRRPVLSSGSVEDDSHREFVFADDVTQCDLEEFKMIIDDKLREIAAAAPAPTSKRTAASF